MWIDDDILRLSHLPQVLRIFVPSQAVVVMSRSNPPRDCDKDFCHSRGIAVLKRLGGGGTVLLDAGCVVISAGIWVNKDFEHPLFFSLFHRALQDFLATHLKLKSHLDGLADVTIQDRKCVGASLFRSQKYLLYQGSLLVNCDIDLMHRCLPHPSREPSYRQGRSHRDFLINLSELKAHLTAQEVCHALQKLYPLALKKHLENYLITPQSSHIPHLKKRLSSATSPHASTRFQTLSDLVLR